MTAYSSPWRRLVAEAIAAGAVCVDCGTSRDLEGDHELPVSRGGLSTRANLAIRCRRCNRHKGARVVRYQLRVPWPLPDQREPHEPATARDEMPSRLRGSRSAGGGHPEKFNALAPPVPATPSPRETVPCS